MHDIAEEYLYSVHMVQHLLISFVVPPLMLMAVPEWLGRLIVVDGSRSARVIRRLVHPLVAGVVFNALQGLMHWGVVVELSVHSGPFHYSMHLLVFASALAMWTPVVGPLRELQLSEPQKMVYLFAMSIVPTVPAAWLTFAEGSVYPVYDHAQRLWGISVTADQQVAGAVMKVLGGFYPVDPDRLQVLPLLGRSAPCRRRGTPSAVRRQHPHHRGRRGRVRALGGRPPKSPACSGRC